MKKVFLGVGHGGSDPGAVFGDILEKDVNLVIALACRDLLVRHGVSVLMSRTEDEEDSLPEEIRECNDYHPDLAVDFHNNAGGGDGAEVYYHHGGGTGRILAENILAEIQKIGQNSRGAKTKINAEGRDYFGFIRETKAPAVIVECAFLDSPEDWKILDTPEKQAQMGAAIGAGILKTLEIPLAEDLPFIPEGEAPREPEKEETERQEGSDRTGFSFRSLLSRLARLLRRLVLFLISRIKK